MVLWARKDSNLRSRKTADLQSAPFGHSGTYPNKRTTMSRRRESNPRPADYKSAALPTELLRQYALSGDECIFFSYIKNFIQRSLPLVIKHSYNFPFFISSITSGFTIVERSPRFCVSPSAILRKILRIIFPERVRGKPLTN